MPQSAMTLFVMIVATLSRRKRIWCGWRLALLLAFILAPVVELLRRARLGRVPSARRGHPCPGFGCGNRRGYRQPTCGPQGTASIRRDGGKEDFYRYRACAVQPLADSADRIGTHSGSSAGNPSAPSENSAAAHPAATASSPRQQSEAPLELARRYLFPVLSPLATFGIVFVVAVFALLQREDLRDRLIRLIGSDDLHRTTLAIDDGGRRLRRVLPDATQHQHGVRDRHRDRTARDWGS